MSGHIPVLVRETVEALAVEPGGRYIDCTLGGGGHAVAILEQSSPGGQLLGIDADPEAIKIAAAKLQPYSDSTLFINDNFTNLKSICVKYDFRPVHGILFDLGLSSLQLENTDRGFSFQRDAHLDMRLNPSQEITAAGIIKTSSETELAHIIKKYGEETYNRQSDRYIVQTRPIETTLQLVQVIERAVKGRRGKIHPATKTFQALRIAVNHELEHLESALKQAIELLGFEGRLVVISYNSLEDRIVKQLMHRESKDCICPPSIPTCICGHTARLRLINKKVVTPSTAEVKLNPRSRSAKLRAVECINTQHTSYNVVENFLAESKTKEWGLPTLLKKAQMAFSLY